jgi:hypothetical protein
VRFRALRLPINDHFHKNSAVSVIETPHQRVFIKIGRFRDLRLPINDRFHKNRAVSGFETPHQRRYS